MKTILLAMTLLCVLATQTGIVNAQVANPQHTAAFECLALPDSILPPGYSALPGRAFPSFTANPLITTESNIIGFISIWFMMATHGEELEDESLDKDQAQEEIEKFTTALSSYVRAAYLAMYLPPPGKGSDEIGVMALLLRPECDLLDGMKEGILHNAMIFVNADTLALYAFTDISDPALVESLQAYFVKQMKK
jgi:hypothetical protein